MTDSPSFPLLTIPGHWDFHYNYYAGAAASRFFFELGTHRRLMGTRCPSCRRVLLPARSFCDACFVATSDWLEVGTTGRLETFTILTTEFPGLPKPPAAIGYVTLDGADTAMLNFVYGVDLDDVDAAGAYLLTRPTVRVEFSEHREGRITDFYFVVDEEKRP